MKRIFGIIIFLMCFFMISPTKAYAKPQKVEGELETTYSVSDEGFKVSKVLDLENEYETKKLEDTISCGKSDEINIDSIIIETAGGKKDIKAYSRDDECSYKISKKSNDYKVCVDLVNTEKIKKVYYEYTCSNLSDYSSYGWHENRIEEKVNNTFMGVKINNQKVYFRDNINAAWIQGEYTNFYNEDGVKELLIEGKSNKSAKLVLCLSSKYDFFGDMNTSKFASDLKYYTKLFEEENNDTTNKSNSSFLSDIKNNSGSIIEKIKGIIFKIIVIIIIIIIILYFIGTALNKRDGKKVVKPSKPSENKNVSDSKKVTTEKQFEMPKYINPAYLGILFNTSEEDIVFTILCELIRKDAVKIKQAESYDKKDIYRKYILSLTEESIELDACEKEFIEKLREIDEINLINLDDIQKLVGKGYFKSVVSRADEAFNNYLREGINAELTVGEVLKNRDIELEKWQEIKEDIKKLKESDIRKLTIKQLEYLHVVSTAIALRDRYFSVFKIFTPAELRISEYFTQVQKKFDNDKTVIEFLEKTFLK